MKLGLYASYWIDERLHEIQLLVCTVDQLTVMMKYGSEWRDSIELTPLDVSAVNSLALTLRRIDE